MLHAKPLALGRLAFRKACNIVIRLFYYNTPLLHAIVTRQCHTPLLHATLQGHRYSSLQLNVVITIK